MGEDLNAFLEATKIIASNTKPVAREQEKTVKDEKEAEEIVTVKLNKEAIKHKAEKEENYTKEEEEDESEEDKDEHESEENKDEHESEENEDEHESEKKAPKEEGKIEEPVEKEEKSVNIASILSQYNQLNTVKPQVTEKIQTKESKKTSFDVSSILAK